MSNVTVELDLNYPVKRTVIKTTPQMTLKAIVTAACEKFQLNADLYGLKLLRTELDLSLSVRFANLAPGAKLSLFIKSTTLRSAVVDIALQTEQHGRLIDKLNSDLSFWDILLHFEKKQNINLTKCFGLPTSDGIFSKMKNIGKKQLYMMPICIFMNKEYATIEDLFSNSLQSAGLSSGNGVIRLLFKFTDKTQPQIEEEIKIAQLKNNSKELSQSKSKSSETVNPPSIPTSSANSAPAAKSIPINNQIPISNAPIHNSSSTEQPQNIPDQPISDFNRDIQLFKPPPEDYIMTRFDLPDDFFELTALELKYLLSSTESNKFSNSNTALKTKMMREREENEKMKKFPKTCIRIRFQNRMTLQLNFLSSEKVAVLFENVRQCLQEPDREFQLYTTPPLKNLEREASFWKHSLSPASLVYFKWCDGGMDVPKLKSSLMENVKEYPILKIEPPANAISVVDVNMDVKMDAELNTKQESSSGMDIETDNMKNQGASSDSLSKRDKIPKWLKLGRK